MSESFDQLVQSVWGFLPNLAAAVAILIVGWFIARILGALVRGGLKKTEFDQRLGDWVGIKKSFPLENFAGRAVFYLVMVFVLVAFFQALSMSIITEPLNALLTGLTEFAPRLLGGAGLLLVAWAVATALRQLVAGAMSNTELDRRLGATALEDGDSIPLGRTLADAVYWLVFLLFLPAILGALAIEGLLAPVQSLTDQVLSFLPNLFAAGLILGVGWLVARMVRRIVTNLLSAAGADAIPERLGLEGAAARIRISHLVGLIVYVLILVPVVVSSLNALALDAVTEPASAMLASMMNAVPGLFAAFLVLAVAYAVGKLVSSLATNVLAGAGFDSLPARLGFDRADGPETRPLSVIAGSVILIVVLVFASVEAADMIGFAALADVLQDLLSFAGQVLLGLVIFAAGLWLANLAADTVRQSGVGQANTLAVVSRVSILTLTGAMALRQMGLADRIIELAFGLVLGSVAVAAALAFGLGARDVAAKVVRSWMEEGTSD